VPGGRVTSDLKRVDPDGHNAMHSGVDVAAPEGTSFGRADGVVRHVGARGNHGGGARPWIGRDHPTVASKLLVREGERVPGSAVARVIYRSGHRSSLHRSPGRRLVDLTQALGMPYVPMISGTEIAVPEAWP
jgi:hypothetical protein